jgi:hypothetical protein
VPQYLIDAGITMEQRTNTNTGVPAFYYDWPVELAAQDAAGSLAATWEANWIAANGRPASCSRTTNQRPKAAECK